MTITAAQLRSLHELARRAIRDNWTVRALLEAIAALPAADRDAGRIVLGHMLVDEVRINRG